MTIAGARVRAWLGWVADTVSPRRRLLNELRAQWGKAGEKDGWLAERCFELHAPEAAAAQVDEKTWRDLEFPSIFRMFDTTVTPVGSQHLYRRMRTYGEDASPTLAEVCQPLRRDPVLRERAQVALAGLRSESAARIVELLYGAPLRGLPMPRLLLLWSLTSVVTVAGALMFSVPPLLAVGVLVTNVAITFATPQHVYQNLAAIGSCLDLIGAADAVGRIRTTAPLPQLQELAATRGARVWMRRTFGLLKLFLAEPVISRWLSFFFLADHVVYVLALDRLQQVRPGLRAAYDLVGAVDAAIAVACMLERFPACCRPQLTHGRVIEIQEGYHPLLARPVTSSLSLRSRSALITGSNMTGKTTFIKMIATNIILGSTLGVCFAARAVIPAAPVMASIHGEHSIESGKSKYFAEMESMLKFLRSAREGQSPVIVIDEPFSGTNTVERVAAAKAVLAALAEHACVLASTHDTELQELLAERFDAYHFSETPELEELYDYRLRPGRSTESNALRLLGRMGFPEDVVADALATAAVRVRGDEAAAAQDPGVGASGC